MNRFHTARCFGNARRGQILVLFGLVLIVLVGMLGLVIDSGLLMATHRQAQNAADSAALAAAMELFEGYSTSTAKDTAIRFVQVHNGLAKADVVVNFGTDISALAAPAHRQPGYVEVYVDLPYTTFLIQVLGGNTTRNVQARAVAGYENVTAGEGAIVLDPRADNYSGLSVGGGAVLRVQGAIYVNSLGKGINAAGDQVSSSYSHYGVATGNNGRIYCTTLQILGGVDVLNNIYNAADYPRTPAPDRGTDPFPLEAGLGAGHMRPDPLQNLPIPVATDSTGNPITKRTSSIIVQNGQTYNFTPGIYEDIQVNGGGTANFAPGIYVLSPTKANQGLRINGSSTVQGQGVMFYVTGSDYVSGGKAPGYYDTLDGAVNMQPGTWTLPDPPPGENLKNVDFASVQINANDGNINLVGIEVGSATPSSPFHNILFFQRRRNLSQFQIAGNAGPNVHLQGTVYTKWANMQMSGGGTYDAQFVVGTLDIQGQAAITINAGGKSFGVINNVFLVE